MNKKILTIAIANIIINPIFAEYLLKQPVEKGIIDNMIVEEASSLYDFSSHTFTNCGQTGRLGPTLTMCQASYNTNWDEDSNYFKMNSFQGYQQWTVPEDGLYSIEAGGASAGLSFNHTSYISKGAKIKGDFNLVKGDVLTIVVGQRSANNPSGNTGGAGASWVVKSNTPLIVAGGGGGTENPNSYHQNMNASINTNGNTNQGSCAVNFGAGSSGNGAPMGDNGNWGGAGGGFYTDGASTATWGGIQGNGGEGGKSYFNGLIGGQAYKYNATGGFGGGAGSYGSGGGAGGAGGYSGGGAGDNNTNCSAGGGGSYNIGSNQLNSIRTDINHGYIIITKI